MKHFDAVKYDLLDGIVKKNIPYGTTWQLRGDSGTGKVSGW